MMNETDILQHQTQYKGLHKAISRRETRRMPMPKDLNEKVVKQAERPKRCVLPWLTAIVGAAAALVLAYTLFIKIEPEETVKPKTAYEENKANKPHKPYKSQESPKPQQPITPNELSEPTEPISLTPQLAAVEPKQKEQTIEIRVPQDEPEPKAEYASVEVKEDTTYKAPAVMEEFIAKLAGFCRAEEAQMDCLKSVDSTTQTRIFLIEEKPEYKVWERLIQMAVWYDNESPGYFLTFSKMQFLFELHDLRLGLKYFWAAERINARRILLYSTHLPLGTPFDMSCYLQYRDQVTGTIERAL